MPNHVVVDGLGNVTAANPTVDKILDVVNKTIAIAEMAVNFVPGNAGTKAKAIVATVKDIVTKATPYLQSEIVGKIVDILVGLLDKTKTERAALATQIKSLLD